MANIEDCPGFETFGADVKAARQAKRISRKAMAEKINIDWRYLANIENEGAILSLPVVIQLIKACGPCGIGGNSFSVCSSFLRMLLSRRCPQNAVYILFDNAVFFQFLFRFAVLCGQPFPFCVQLFILGFEGVQVGELCDPGLFERLCRRLTQDQLAFMLPPERGLFFGVSQFQRHRPELLVGGEVFYQQRHIPKASFRVFQGVDKGAWQVLFALECLQYAAVLSQLSNFPDSVWKIELVALL